MIFNMIGKGGSGESLIISDTIDSNGGIIRTITGKVVKLQTKTITPTSSTQVVNPDDGYDGFSKVTVEAGGGGTPTIQSLSVTPTTSQQTFNASDVDGYKPVTVNAMPSGTAGTPTATKGAVSNHSVSVTPSVTNTTGYIIGSTKTGTAVTVSASELVSGTKSISANGTGIDVTEYASVDVNVSAPSPTLQSKTYNISSAGTTTITADVGYDGLSDVEVSVPSALQFPSINYRYVTENSTRKWKVLPRTIVDPEEGCREGWIDEGVYDGTEQVFYAVPSGTTITPSTSAQTIGGANYMMEGAVTVSAMPTMTLPTSASSSATSGYTNKATISRSTSTQYINIPTGYNSAGGYYTISATPNGTVTTPSSISGTTATVTTGTNTLTLTKTVSVTPNVTTAGYISSGTAGNASVSLTANVTTKAAATITPSTSNQTIASGTYLTGTQTIAGDSDLVGGNILSTANIFGVQGTVVVQNYYTGSSAPSSSTGSNGDLYLQS